MRRGGTICEVIIAAPVVAGLNQLEQNGADEACDVALPAKMPATLAPRVTFSVALKRMVSSDLSACIRVRFGHKLGLGGLGAMPIPPPLFDIVNPIVSCKPAENRRETGK
ncbi:MAG TPA: hypothetical protein VGD08_20530 [Stellaceae bacterium]|jgi:hypothetical protein